MTAVSIKKAKLSPTEYNIAVVLLTVILVSPRIKKPGINDMLINSTTCLKGETLMPNLLRSNNARVIS